MLEGYFKQFATTFRNFKKISEDVRRLSKSSDNFQIFHKKFKMLEGRLSYFAIFSAFFRRIPKISEHFRRFLKIFKKFGNLSECLFLHSLVLFPKFPRNFQIFVCVTESCLARYNF